MLLSLVWLSFFKSLREEYHKYTLIIDSKTFSTLNIHKINKNPNFP